MLLLEKFHELLRPWRSAFAQQRTWQRAQRLAYGLLLCLRTHLTSNAICATGRQFLDWSADYRLFSRSPWDPHALFDPIFDHLAALLASPQAPVVAALDDTRCKKTGRHIPGATYARAPGYPGSTTLSYESVPRTALRAGLRAGAGHPVPGTGTCFTGAL